MPHRLIPRHTNPRAWLDQTEPARRRNHRLAPYHSGPYYGNNNRCTTTFDFRPCGATRPCELRKCLQTGRRVVRWSESVRPRSRHAAEGVLEHGEVAEVGVAVGVEVGEAAAGAGVVFRPAVDSGAIVGEAFVKEEVVAKVDVVLTVEVAASVLRNVPEANVVPLINGRLMPGPALPRNPSVAAWERAFGESGATGTPSMNHP